MDKNTHSYFKGFTDGAAQRAAEMPEGAKSITNVSSVVPGKVF